MNRFVLPRAARRALYSTAGVALLGTAVMGFAHTPPGRPLLHWMGLSMKGAGAACPLGYDVKQSPEQKEAARQGFAASHRGARPAGARPSLGFTFEKTTREEVLAWASAHGVKCTAPRARADLDCEKVPAALFPGSGRQADITNLWLTFSGGGTLASLIAISREKDAAPITASFVAANEALTRLSGPADKQSGEGTPTWLAQGALRQASAEYRFQDFYALTRVTNMSDGYVLTEEYRALPTLPAEALLSR